ncbi:hypothetical protein [Tamlana sp. I1]|uniref:hypothetical protein n=1 Tax=Tamlana sp. I1 TaxID=2762061 RepID=UPI00188F4DBF|nr:hypothetical protein [Tamlana sp. I1]
MLKGLTALLIFAISFSLQAQDTLKVEAPVKKVGFTVDSTAVLTLNSTIKTLYTVLSAKKDTLRNWKQFKALFKKDAKLIPTGKDKMGVYQVKYLSPDDYMKKTNEWFKSNGYIIKEVHRKTNVFGNIAQVFSTFEAYHKKSDNKPFLRGINSIQLLYDEERWWIINVFWTQESHNNLIPKAYLPN